MVYLCGRPLPQPRPLHAGPRDRDPADALGRRWLAAHHRRRRRPDARGARAGSCRRAAARRPRRAREDFDADTLPIDFQWLRTPDADRLFSLRARPGHLRLFGRETHRQSVHAVARGAPAAGALLQRVDRDGIRAGSLPADGRPRLLLQQREVSLLYVSRDDDRQAPARDVGTPRPGDGGRVHAADPDRVRRADRAARRGRLRAAALRLARRVRRRGNGCRRCSTPASCRTRPLRRGCPTSPARSSAWRARTSPARRSRRTSTGSNTAKTRTCTITR